MSLESSTNATRLYKPPRSHEIICVNASEIPARNPKPVCITNADGTVVVDFSHCKSYPGISLDAFLPSVSIKEGWRRILEEVKSEVAPPEFDKFFKRTHCDFEDYGTIFVYYPNDCPRPDKKWNRLLIRAAARLKLDVKDIEWMSYEDDEGDSGFPCHTLAETKAQNIDWLVKGYIAKGMLTYLFAPKGRGKTKLCDWFTAGVTRKGRTVIRFNLEDDERIILKPCLHAAGADLDRVVIPENLDGSQADFSDPDHIEKLKKLIIHTQTALVIIEPVNNYKGRGKSNSEDDMRPIYMALAEVARETGCAILGVGHTNKKQDVDVLDKAMGDGSHTRVARVNFYLDRNPNDHDERILTNAGSNLPVGPAMVFRMVQKPPFELDETMQEGIAIAVKQRTEDISGDELLEETRNNKISNSMSKSIEQFLVKFLAGKGWMDTVTIREAMDPKWPWDLVKKVFHRKKLGKGRTEGFGKNKRTFWTLA